LRARKYSGLKYKRENMAFQRQQSHLIHGHK